MAPDKATQYAALFEKSGAQNGILPGEQAKSIFERAGLPNEVLGRIWNLADTEQRGALQCTEFVIAMHLLASFKAGALRTLPNVLPAGLYEAAARRAPSRQSSAQVVSAIPRQFSGQNNGGVRVASPLGRSAYSAPPPPQQQFAQTTGDAWAINPTDKGKFDTIYATLDKQNKGFITGDEAVPFFSESRLPEETLAQIWDLSDINSAGHLTRDEFAVAMYLIRQQRGRKDGGSLPDTLPPNLIPPRMRTQNGRAPPIQEESPFDVTPAQAPQMAKSAADDLFGLDALSAPAPPPVQLAHSTGGSNSFAGADPFGNARSPITPSSPTGSSPVHSTVFKPFAPSSSFGQALSYNATGGSNSSAPSQSRSMGHQQSSGAEDLLGDNDPEISKRLTDETTELANLSNQVGSLSRQMQEVQGQRAGTQNELTQANSQKHEFETRLAQLRTLYEKEVKDVRSLEERLNASKSETKKLQTDIAIIDGTYQDLQGQHRQIATALQADQQENASLKEKMRVLNGEIVQMKPILEKLRSDARQQKGLVAINKKQLATNEGEREKLKTEAEDLTKSIEEDKKTLAEAAKSQTQTPREVVSPAPSTMSANNPFFRRQGSTSDIPSSAYTSPPIPQQPEHNFDSLFGPSFDSGSGSASSAPPPVTFRKDTEVRSTSSASNPVFPPHLHQSDGGYESPGDSSSVKSRDLAPANEIPPPPESRQISSSFLPFPEHEDSVTSSRRVSAPNSRSEADGSTGADTPTNYIGSTPTGSSVAGQTDNARAVSPGLERHATSPSVTDKEVIPGAFPGDEHSTVIGTPTGGTTISEQAAADPFPMPKGITRTGTVKDDFDSAFAGFGSSAKAPERSSTGNSSSEGSAGVVPAHFNKEFPPIAELEHDDESDSASEGGGFGGGFDDDFAPESPERKTTQAPTQPVAPATNEFLGVRPVLSPSVSAQSIGTNPPTPGAQAAPPTYDTTVSPTEHSQADLQQYSNLLPTREIPTSPTAEKAAQPAQSSFGASPGPVPTTAQPPVPASKAPFDDDFDNDFDDLEDAKEGDADDDFANMSASNRSGLDDFNAMFDSPPEPKSVERSHTANSSNTFGEDSGFGDFTQSPMTNTHATTTTANTADSHDWDAIFGSLDGPSSSNAAGETPTTAAAPAAEALHNGTTPPAAVTPATAAATTATTGKERPVIGRALTEAGVHDDPILKNLTGMGYDRLKALDALEKYDYNLERVSSLYISLIYTLN